MFFLIFCSVVYFLPSIIGHDKHSFAGIFLLDFFLEWTVIGWVCALIWACTAEVRTPVLAVAGPGRYCSRCGAVGPQTAHFCWACGSRV
jgi:hypothetical protein